MISGDQFSTAVGTMDVDNDLLGVRALQSSVDSLRKREWKVLQQAVNIQKK